jgi:hypothetical protein
VSEHGGARLEARAPLDLALELLPDPPEALVAELVLAAVDHLEAALLRSCALGRDDHREVAPARVAPANQPADLVDVEGPFGDQDHVGAPGKPAV